MSNNLFVFFDVRQVLVEEGNLVRHASPSFFIWLHIFSLHDLIAFLIDTRVLLVSIHAALDRLFGDLAQVFCFKSEG